MRLLAIGLGIGLIARVGVGFSMGSLLNDLSPAVPLTLAGVTALLAAVTMVATAIPALRASRIDPVVASRSE